MGSGGSQSGKRCLDDEPERDASPPPCTSASASEAQPCHPTVQHRSIDARALETGEIDTEDNVTEQKQADLYCDSAGEQMVIAIDNMNKRTTDSEGRSFFGKKKAIKARRNMFTVFRVIGIGF